MAQVAASVTSAKVPVVFAVYLDFASQVLPGPLDGSPFVVQVSGSVVKIAGLLPWKHELPVLLVGADASSGSV